MTRVRIGQINQHSLADALHNVCDFRDERYQQTRNRSCLWINLEINWRPKLSQAFQNLQNARRSFTRVKPGRLIALDCYAESIRISSYRLRRRHALDARFDSNDSSDDCVLVRHKGPSFLLSV